MLSSNRLGMPRGLLNPPCFLSSWARTTLPPAAVRHWRRQRSCYSTRALCQPATPSCSLAPTRASTSTGWPSLACIAPESKPWRPCRHCLAAGHRRRPLRPHLRHQSISGEQLGTPVPFVVQVRPAIVAGEPSPRRKGTLVRIAIVLGPEC
jgi:hypothetical protein